MLLGYLLIKQCTLELTNEGTTFCAYTANFSCPSLFPYHLCQTPQSYFVVVGYANAATPAQMSLFYLNMPIPISFFTLEGTMWVTSVAQGLNTMNWRWG